MRYLILLFCLASNAFADVVNVICPAEVDIAPCQCFPKTAQIHCLGKEITDENIKTIGSKLKSDKGVFHLLYISETKITKIEKNSLTQSAFERIFISENHDLVGIDPDAFLAGHLSGLVIHNNPQLQTPDIFVLARNLAPTSTIEINGNFIKEIPEMAFEPKSGNSPLETIYLSNNTYNEKIGKNAFLGHPNLTQLALDNNDIKKVDDYAFNFTNPPTARHHLNISLNNNKLDGTSFTNNSFIIPSNLYLTLHLENNAFTNLPEEVFKAIASDGNNLVLNGNKFECNCGMKWVLEKPQSTNIFNIHCVNHNNKSIFELTLKDLGCY